MASDAEFLSGEDEGEPSDAEAFSFQNVPPMPVPSFQGSLHSMASDGAPPPTAGRDDDTSVPASAGTVRRASIEDARPKSSFGDNSAAPALSRASSQNQSIRSKASQPAGPSNGSTREGSVLGDLTQHGSAQRHITVTDSVQSTDQKPSVAAPLSAGEEGAPEVLPDVPEEFSEGQPSVSDVQPSVSEDSDVVRADREGDGANGDAPPAIAAEKILMDAGEQPQPLLVPRPLPGRVREPRREKGSTALDPATGEARVLPLVQRVFFEASRGRRMVAVGELATAFMADAAVQDLWHTSSSDLSDDEGNLLLYIETLGASDRKLVSWEQFVSQLEYEYSDREGPLSPDGFAPPDAEDIGSADGYSSSTSAPSPPRLLTRKRSPPSRVKAKPAGAAARGRTQQKSTAFALHTGKKPGRSCPPGTPPFHDPSRALRSTSASRTRELENAHARPTTDAPRRAMSFGLAKGVNPDIGDGTAAHPIPGRQRSGSRGERATPLNRPCQATERARAAQQEAHRRAVLNSHLHRTPSGSRQSHEPQPRVTPSQQLSAAATTSPTREEAAASPPAATPPPQRNVSATAVEMAMTDLRDLLPHEMGTPPGPAARVGVLLSPDPQGRASHQPGGASDTDTLLGILRDRLSPAPQPRSPGGDGGSATEILCLQTFISQQRDIIKALEKRLADSEDDFKKSVKRERRAQRRERETLQQKEVLETKLLQLSDPKRLRRVLQKHEESEGRSIPNAHTPRQRSPRRAAATLTSPRSPRKRAMSTISVQTDALEEQGYLDTEAVAAKVAAVEEAAQAAQEVTNRSFKEETALLRRQAAAELSQVKDARDAEAAKRGEVADECDALRRDLRAAKDQARTMSVQAQAAAKENDDVAAAYMQLKQLLEAAEKNHPGISKLGLCCVCGGRQNLELRKSGWKCKNCHGKKHKK